MKMYEYFVKYKNFINILLQISSVDFSSEDQIEILASLGIRK